MNLSKEKLVILLIRVEQYMAKNNKKRGNETL